MKFIPCPSQNGVAQMMTAQDCGAMKMQGIGVCSAVSLMPKVVPPPTDPTDPTDEEETELPSDEDIEEMEDGSRFFFFGCGVFIYVFFF